jgi:large subunit ribosomal protein L32e
MVTKKKHAVFRVPNYGAKNRKGVKKRWRKPRGIDSKIRVEKKGHGATPKVGYKNSSEIRFARQDGTFEHLVHNERELLAIAGDKTKVAVLAHGLSRRTWASLQKTAAAKGIRIVNRKKEQAPEARKEKKTVPVAKQAPSEAKHEHEHAHEHAHEHSAAEQEGGKPSNVVKS